MNENVIEWLKGSDRVTITACSGSALKNKLIKLAEQYPEECDYVENSDGSVCGHVPVKYISVRHPRVVTDEQKALFVARTQGKNEAKSLEMSCDVEFSLDEETEAK